MTRNVLALSALLCGAAVADLGIIDTVGGTIYDWQYGWCAYRYIAQAPGHGIHVTWIRATDTTMGNPDRNTGYNYYDFSTRRWTWIDTNFMLSGTNVFQERSGFGSLDADPASGVAVISCHQIDREIRPVVGREVAPGSGTFEYCDGSPALDGYLWPASAVSRNQTIHLHCLDNASRDEVWYSRVTTWCNWDPPLRAASQPAAFPTNNIAASKISDKVCLAWVKTEEFPYILYYRESTDGGDNWNPEVDLDYPPAFGPDTGCSYYITSAFPFYDRHDRLHVVVDVMPIIADTGFRAPTEIWHWCSDNTPTWSRVHRADADSRGRYDPGTCAMLACRPSIGEDSRGNLFVSWEQFDTLNVEPLTDLMRADIWLAGSSDGGNMWQPAVRITEPNTQSKRLPNIIDLAIAGGTDPDTVIVLYLADSVAGFKSGASPVGPWSFSPMIAQGVTADLILSGVGEQHTEARRRKLEVRVQSPVSGRAVIQYSLPVGGDVSLQILDAAGRVVAVLARGDRTAGSHSAVWHAPRAGVYFCRLTAAAGSATSSFTSVR